MPILEYPDQRAEGRRQRERIQHNRLERHDDRASHQEEQDEDRQHHDQQGVGQGRPQVGEQVHLIGRFAAHQRLESAGNAEGANLA